MTSAGRDLAAEQRKRALADAERVARAEQARLLEEQHAIAEAERHALAAEREAERERIRLAAVGRVAAVLAADPLATDEDILERLGDDIGHEAIEAARDEIVALWRAGNRALKLSREQRDVVTLPRTNVVVRARAGSGKTRALVARAAFLMDACRVRPEQILVLAFNRDAVDEVRRRFAERSGESQPFVETYDAAIYAIADAPWSVMDEGREAGMLDDLKRSVLEDRDLLRERVRLTRALAGSGAEPVNVVNEPAGERFLTLPGQWVKSYGEQLIANTLFKWSVPFEYERAHRWDNRWYRPDFTVGAARVAIEYFGIRGDPVYEAERVSKRGYWERRRQWTLIELTPTDVSGRPENAEKRLVAALQKAGVRTSQRPPMDVAQAERQIATEFVDKALIRFVQRSRASGVDVMTLRARSAAIPPSGDPESAFRALAVHAASFCEQWLHDHRVADHPRLATRALGNLATARRRYALSKGHGDLVVDDLQFILVDEFQDINGRYAAVLRELLRINPGATIFAVGDDWQAINGFNGADTQFIERFAEQFPEARPVVEAVLRTNNRSAPEIVAAGNLLMDGRGAEAIARTQTKGIVRRVRTGIAHGIESGPPDLSLGRRSGDPVPSGIEYVRFAAPHRPLTMLLALSELSRVTHDLLARHRDVAVLTRTNSPFGFASLSALHAELARGLAADASMRLSVLTAHTSKGREFDAVVLTEVDEGRYPLIHPTWWFGRVLGDSLQSLTESERRLFYVAMSRARFELVLMADAVRPSPFVVELALHGAEHRSAAMYRVPDLPTSTERVGMLHLRSGSGSDLQELREHLRRDGWWFFEGMGWLKRLDANRSLAGFIRAAHDQGAVTDLEVVDLNGTPVTQ